MDALTKAAIIRAYERMGEKPLLFSTKCGKSFTAKEMITEIQNETEEGISHYKNVISISVHILEKGFNS